MNHHCYPRCLIVYLALPCFFIVSLVFPAYLYSQRIVQNYYSFRTIGPTYSSLSQEQRVRIEKRIAPPPLHLRDNPYATPMYYLLSRGYGDGYGKTFKLQKNRPDWQEVLVKDWAELGLTSTLLLTWPMQWKDPDKVKQLHHYLRLSKKYGLSVGIRLGGSKDFGGISRSGWDVHPKNENNRIQEYVDWVKEVAQEVKGYATYYIVGDEVNANYWERADGKGGTAYSRAPEAHRWTPEIYLEVFDRIAQVIKSIDVQAKVSMFGMANLEWSYAEKLLDLGFAQHGDAVAANVTRLRPYQEMVAFVRQVKAKAPGFEVYSNGVGYIGSENALPNPVNQKYPVYSEKEQALLLARAMFMYYAAGWDRAPYYITVRQWRLANGKTIPHWYGVFGITDLILDQQDRMTIKRHLSWYAYQTISHIFHTQRHTQPADFKVKFSKSVDFYKVYTRHGRECLIILWNNQDTRKTTITLPDKDYRYPVKVSLYNYNVLTDIPYDLLNGQVILPAIEIGREPVIIRLIQQGEVAADL